MSRTKNRLNYKAVATLATLGAMVSALVVAVSASAAGHAATTQVTTVDPTGAVFTCPGTNYTVLGGTVRLVSHDSTAADGSEHLTDTTGRFPVRIPDNLHKFMKAVAEKNRRSLHSEVLVALEQHVEANRHLEPAEQAS